jgi:hypothetical protein
MPTTYADLEQRYHAALRKVAELEATRCPKIAVSADGIHFCADLNALLEHDEAVQLLRCTMVNLKKGMPKSIQRLQAKEIHDFLEKAPR